MIIIRDVKLEDTSSLVNIYKPYVEKTAITFEYDVPTVEQFRDRIKKITKKFPYLVAEEDGEILGYAYAMSFHERIAYQWTVEVSVYLAENIRGKGVGKKLYLQLEELLKNQGIKTLTACITYPGSGSIEFHEKLNFEKVAHFKKVGFKLDAWHDVVWYQKNIADYDNNPQNITYKN